MLRRRLLLNFGPLVLMLLAVAVAATVMLQQSLTRLDHIDTAGWAAVERVANLTSISGHIEADVHELAAPVGGSSSVSAVMDDLHSTLAELGRLVEAPSPCCEGALEPLCQAVRRTVPGLISSAQRVRTAPTSAARQQAAGEMFAGVAALRNRISELSTAVRENVKGEQAAVLRSFRRTVIGLTVVFVILINAAVVLLLWTGGLVVRPVERLVAATRELGEGHFDHRVTLPHASTGADEFGELADAVNGLAGRLEAGEKRQMETLSQVALAMSHELNNAISIIELQMKLLTRRTAGSPELERCLTQIHGSLRRVTEAVRGLQNVRRIVLTDYLPGMKMLDLVRSQLPESADRPLTATAEEEHDLPMPRA